MTRFQGVLMQAVIIMINSHVCKQTSNNFPEISNLAVQVPIKSLLIDGNCRVEDRGIQNHHGHVCCSFSRCIYEFC